MILDELQKRIEAIYRLDDLPSIRQFLISTDELKKLLPGEEAPKPQVLFREEDGEVFLAVHFGDECLQRVQREGIERCTLSDFCSVAEEISHFLYLSWRAQNQRPVSLLDVELQGEIDKFLLALEVFGDSSVDFFSRLFDRVRFHDQDPKPIKDRYIQANRLGGKFCKSLLDAVRSGNVSQTLSELRDFYRKASQKRILQAVRS